MASTWHSLQEDSPSDRRWRPTRGPLWLRLLAALIVAGCGLMLFAMPPSAESYYIWAARDATVNATDHGWPLPAVRMNWTRENAPTLEAIDVRWPGLLYDLSLIAALSLTAGCYLLPWREFPRLRFALADFFVLITCLTVGALLWHQTCIVGIEIWTNRRHFIGINTAAYLIVSLVYAGVFNGLLAEMGQVFARPAPKSE